MHFESLMLRPAQPSEAAALSDLALRSKAHWGYDQAFLDAVRDELAVLPQWCDGARLVVAQQASTLRGFYRFGGEPPAGELTDLFVDPVAIGTGVGGQLLRHARATARGLGYQRLVIDADPLAEGFYLHAGAVRIGDVPSGSIPGRMLPQLELDAY